MSATIMTSGRDLSALSRTALKGATWLWFSVMVAGQAIFALAVAAFYGHAAWRGQWQGWNRFMTHGYVAGDRAGNLATALHVFSAVIVIGAGAIQFVPKIRRVAPRFHRWNGRIYILCAFTVSLAGLYMMWLRAPAGTPVQHIGTSLLAGLIMLCAVMALRRAMARDFAAHRRWALRLYVVVSAAMFIRAGYILGVMIAQAAWGTDPSALSGFYLSVLSFAQYIVPLAVLELYLRVQSGGGTTARLAMAGGLFCATLLLAGGIAAASAAIWVPSLQAATDPRIPITDPLAATLATDGAAAAVRQYRDFATHPPGTYDLDEDQLNSLGYSLIRAHRFSDAIAMLKLNVAAYPRSANTYDSLAEAFMDAGDTAQAIANYRAALRLNPASTNAMAMLRKLGAP